MFFLRYQKIYDSAGAYQKGNLSATTPAASRCKSSNAANDWLVQEKIHGSNFSVYCNGSNDIRFAKRNGFLNPDSDRFYEFQRIQDLSTAKTQRLWTLLTSSPEARSTIFHLGEQFLATDPRTSGPKNGASKSTPCSADQQVEPKIEQMTVYGELFGGYLPSPQEAAGGWERLFAARTGGHRSGASTSAPTIFSPTPVQEGVYYSASLDFVVFDVAVLFSCLDENGDERRVVVFLPYDTVENFASSVGFLVSEPLHRTSRYEVCANFCVKDRVSALALKLNGGASGNLKTFLQRENLAEGVVVRPAGGQAFPVATTVNHATDADVLDVPARLLLKIKNPRFAELVENCEGEGGAASASDESCFRVRVARLTNRNRLAAVLSKDLGHPPAFGVDGEEGSRARQTWSDAAAEQLKADVWESFWENGWGLGRVQWEEADEFIGQECERVVADFWKETLGGVGS